MAKSANSQRIMSLSADKGTRVLPMRTRQQYGKSRAGCQQCKRSRRKCDLRQPDCHNCERRNVQCGGYDVPLRWTSKHQPSHANVRQPTSTSMHTRSMPSCDDTSHKGIVGSRTNPKTTPSHVQAQKRLPFVAPADGHDHLKTYNSSFVADDQHNVPKTELGAGDKQTAGTVYPCRNRDLQPGCVTSKDCTTLESWKDSPPGPSLPRDLVDVGTTLIAYWFSSVCPMWSIFDSEVNFNRRIALDKWAYSEPVFCSLQAMSAAYLVGRMPHLRIKFRSLIDQAVSATERAMQVGCSSKDIAVDVVFAVFALGTTSHWSESCAVGLRWLHAARYLLQAWKSNEDVTDIPTFLYGYFRQALSYWEMLACLTREVPNLEQLDPAGTSKEKPLAGSKTGMIPCASHEFDQIEACSLLAGTRPNSWCGVSSEVIEIFGRVLALCRDARCRCSTTNEHSLDGPCSARSKSGLERARQLRADLFKLDFSAAVDMDTALGFCLQTLDDRTPTSHLLQIAEAYRTASYLQLYLTFDGLMSEDPKLLSIGATVAEIAVQLIEDLEQIPRDSGSKRVQLMLYVAAATGLRPDIDSLDAPHNSFPVDGRSRLTIWRSREVVLDRLNMLEQTLPPQPINIAKDLVRLVWAAYDDRRDQQERIHWLDVMMDTGLRTMFG